MPTLLPVADRCVSRCCASVDRVARRRRSRALGVAAEHADAPVGRHSAAHVREVHAAERARSDPQPEARPADGGGEPLVPRRPRQRSGRPHRVRAPVRAHDVPELEARARRLALQAARGGRRQRHQRHHRLRPHQLLRDRAVESARARALARVRPHGLPAREGRPGVALEPAGRGAQRAPAERREPAVRPRRRGGRCRLLFPKGHPYYGNVIGSHEDIQAAKLDDVQRFFRQYYAPNNASLAIVGDFDPAQAKALVDQVLRHASSAGRRCRPIKADTPKITVRAPPGRAVARASCRASTWRGSRRRSSSRATPTPTSPRSVLGGGRFEPPVQEAGLREADRAERLARSSTR